MSPFKIVTDNLIKWDDPTENTLALLTIRQKELLKSLEEQISLLDIDHSLKYDEKTFGINKNHLRKSARRIEMYQELLQCYTELEKKNVIEQDEKYTTYLNQLVDRRAECQTLDSQIEKSLEDFTNLSEQYSVVSDKTTSLHNASEQLIDDQKKLNDLSQSVTECIKHFKDVDIIMDKLEAPTLSVNSETFSNLITRIDINMDFMQKNSSFKESQTYLIKYKHCQSKAITLITNYICKSLTNATDSIFKSGNLDENSGVTLTLFYGRFQTTLPKVKSIIDKIESLSYKRQEYDTLLNDCRQHYLSLRGLVLGPSIEKALQSVKDKYNGDQCSLVRHSCALLLHASIDEHRLFYQFFSKFSPHLTAYLEGLCTALYDTLRPLIIHINHLETLAEICCILRIEMMDEHVQNNVEPLQGFGNVCLQLLHDVQERLVFRAHLYLKTDVMGYKPSPGDLSYPEKLKMMAEIAQSIRGEELKRNRLKKISVSSMESNVSEPISKNHLMIDSIYQKNNMGNSPADLHGMWYPTVRRTLVCLSRLYRCLDRPVFQSLSQEAITLCVRSIKDAGIQIEARSSQLDAELFQIKHLLILREQIAPFQVDFTVKEYTLDFSKVKTAMLGLLEKRSRLFTLSNNALLEFLLEGTPQIKENLIDSRKHVDAELKSTCQRLIKNSTNLLIEPVIKLLEKTQFSVQQELMDSYKNQVLDSVQNVAIAISEALKSIKFKLPVIQQLMQLYLANRETECILFRPIRNNIVAAFTQLQQILSSHYSAEELLLIACPVPEQISVMLSSSSLFQVKKIDQEESELEQIPKAETSTDTLSFVNTVPSEKTKV